MTPDALARLHAAAFDRGGAWSAEAFAASLADPAVFLCGGAAGVALGRVAADEAELLTLAVHPEARRRGRGRRLLAAFERDAMARGAARAFLEVAADNLAARSLYAAAGYQEAGRRSGYYRDAEDGREDAMVLAKPLAAAGGVATRAGAASREASRGENG